MEVEIRAKVDDLSSIKRKLEAMGTKFGAEKKQTDHIYKKKGEENKAQGPGDYIMRVRDDHKKKLTFKALTDMTGVWVEKEVVIDDVDNMMKILEGIGFVKRITMKKTRIVGKLDDFEVCLDNIEGLGTYIEVELNSEDKHGAKKRIMDLLNKLGIREDEVEHKGYVALLFQKQGVKFKGTG